MIPIENLVAFMLTSLVIIVIPGPSVLFVIGRAIALGRRAGVLSVVGNALGTIPAVIAVAFGVGAIVASSVVAFTVIKIAGALYLVYLGIQAIRHRHAHIPGIQQRPTRTWAAPFIRSGRCASRRFPVDGCIAERSRPVRGIRAMSAGGHGCTRSSSRRSRPGRAAASRSC